MSVDKGDIMKKMTQITKKERFINGINFF